MEEETSDLNTSEVGEKKNRKPDFENVRIYCSLTK